MIKVEVYHINRARDYIGDFTVEQYNNTASRKWQKVHRAIENTTSDKTNTYNTSYEYPDFVAQFCPTHGHV